MKGFFEAPKPVRIHKKKTKTYTCEDCGLYKTCRSPRMEAMGKGEKKILFIGEAPGKTDDLRGKQSVGEAGELLRDMLDSLHFDFNKDARKMDAVSCRPIKGAAPTKLQISACRNRVFEEIERFKPHVIVLLGHAALCSFLEHRSDESLGPITKWRGWAIPDQKYKCWVVPTYHPSYILKCTKEPIVKKIFRKDLKKALSLLNTEVPDYVPSPNASVILHSETDAIKVLQNVLEKRPPWLSFDYETTGLKPYREGHKVVTASLCYNRNEAYSFFMTDNILPYWKKMLEAEGIRKIAHHLKFEDLWSSVSLGTEVNSWGWCSLEAAHVLDNRNQATGLKFQVYANYGILGYEADVKPYLECGDEEKAKFGANGFNRIFDAPKEKLLKYNAEDSYWTFRLAMDQMKQIKQNKGLFRANQLLFNGAKALAKAERKGIRVDLPLLETFLSHKERQIQYFEEELLDLPEVKQWKKKYGAAFNLGSDDQLEDILYNEMGIEATKKTKGGKNSVDKLVLETIDVPLVKGILQKRKVETQRDTILGIRRETTNFILHPFFHLHKVITYRSASANPNFQNLPVRDPESKKIRRVFYPRHGFLLGESDYSGIEVRISACYHRDPMMIKYITDPTTDMHRDTAQDCYLLEDDEWTKNTRYCAKNKFVFPQFYGSWYKPCASDLWLAIDIMDLKTKKDVPLKEHLRSKGIKNEKDFEKHIQEVEDHFWNKRFAVYNRWKKETWEEYNRKGFIEYHTGFRVSGVMRRNEVLNYPIQGSAFHCLLRSFHRLTEELAEGKWKSFLIGQIHDSIVSNIHPEEVDEYYKLNHRIMCEELREEWKWICVPLEIEMEVTGIDRPWYEKKVYVPN